MAFTTTTAWDVRTTGNNSNGGGFDTATAGTDYSQQDSPQVAFTDLVINGTTNTKCTSSANPFTSAHVGNIINITSGSGFTVQRVQIVSVTSGVATCDKSLGTLSSTGGHGNLGGGLATIATAIAAAVSINSIHIKAGTYTLTSSLTTANGQWLAFIGYGITHNDNGTKPLITTSAANTNLFALGNAVGVFRNIAFSNTYSVVSGRFAAVQASNNACVMDGCTSTGCGQLLYGPSCPAAEVVNCVCTNGTDAVYWGTSGPLYVFGCYFYSNSGSGINVQASAPVSVARTIFAGNTASDISLISTWNNLLSVSECVFYGGSASGIQSAQTSPNADMALAFIDNIFYGKGAFGISLANWSLFLAFVQRNNAFGANTSGNRNTGGIAGISDIPLSANPFTNASSGDFSLNGTAGAGVACKAAGFPGSFPGGTSTGYVDVGAVQGPSIGVAGVPIPAGANLAGGTTGSAYSETISAQGGSSPYTFAVTSGSLPTGTSLNSSTGVISGTTSAAGTFTFTITATDANGYTGSQSFTIVVANASSGGGSSHVFIA